MGRQIGDSSSVLHSSIVLLQERFKQLERVKERRELQRLAAGAQRPSWPFFHPDLFQTSPAPAASSPSVSLWPAARSTAQSNLIAGNDADTVDTSLHL
ncbi:hypothetical protein Cni_G20432 [Canna indica]|uniref:Uncharacterized protein n=1 Tax=Canna indica TaxID=4628 RepID=A0AAQ3QJI1_9LILI|nr:hypothetical protein Cni_G20432 [Canna indica]